MALRITKVLNVVSKVATTATNIDNASNFQFLPQITNAIKGSGLDFLSVNNVLGSVTGIDLKKYLTMDNITKFLDLDIDLTNIMPSSLDLSNFGGKDLSLDSVEDKFSNLKMPDLTSFTSGLNLDGKSGNTDEMFSSLSSDVSGALSSIDIGSTDVFGAFDYTSLF